MYRYDEILKLLHKYKEGKSVSLEEKAKDGKAELEINSANTLFAISLSHKDSIKVFKHQKVADWIVLEFLDDTHKRINLHLIELKKTITDSSWQKIKEQLKGAYEHSFLLKALFNYEIDKICCYSAFVYDKLTSNSIANTTNPILLKNSVGNKNMTSSIDWENDEVNITNQIINHKKIKLNLADEVGKGIYNI